MVSVLVAAILSSLASAQVDPHASYHKLVSANGFGVVVLNGHNPAGPTLDVFSDHLYQQWDAASEPAWDLLYDTYFGLADASGHRWLRSAQDFGYENGTNILWVDRSQGSVTLTEYIFAPMELAHPAFAHILYVRNDGPTAVTGLRVFSLHNYHVGTDDGAGTRNLDEAIWMEDGQLFEEGAGTGLGMHITPIVPVHSFSCDQVYDTVVAGQDLDGRCGTPDSPWIHDDQVGGLEWSLDLEPGEEAWVGVAQGFTSGSDAGPESALVQAWIEGRSPLALLDAERTWWEDWLGQNPLPAGLTADETAVYRQSLAFLKMGQVREDNDGYGQILASLPLTARIGDHFSHIWNIAWVRDGAYAIRGLTAAGYLEEARAALAFLLQGKAGDYQSYVGHPYAVSVCRCYGDGSEWSDDDGTGPNIEYDNFGLLLWALGRYEDVSGDLTLVEQTEDVVFAGMADVLVALIQPDGDGAGLIVPDSSIWERHWDGNQKHFTYTSTWAVRGLREAADMAERHGRDGEPYRVAADTVASAICRWLVREDRVLVGNLQEHQQGLGAMDLAAVDAFNNGTLDAASDVGLASLAEWDRTLRVASGNGYKRNDDGDLYDEQEWVMVDLRVAEARRRACQVSEAQALEDWITSQAVANRWTIPELMDPDTAELAGPAPMMGFGAGMYLLTLNNRQVAAEDCEDGVVARCDDGGADTGMDTGIDTDTGPRDSGQDRGEPPGEGCDCGTAPRPAGGALLMALGALALGWRRRG